MREVGAFLAAVVLVTGLSPVVFFFQILRLLWRGSRVGTYLWSVALGLDQLGGSLIYGKINWTVSGYTGYLASKGNPFAGWFAAFIDGIFGPGHCAQSYTWDLNYDALREID